MRGHLLLDAAEKGNTELVLSLLEQGIDIESRDQFGYTPLLWAARRGHMPVVTTLLEKGANLHARSKHGKTALMCAADKGHLEVVRLLVEKGAEVNYTDEGRGTPLFYAISDEPNSKDIITLLLENGADINTRTIEPYPVTPLQFAVALNLDEIAELLKQAGAKE